MSNVATPSRLRPLRRVGPRLAALILSVLGATSSVLAQTDPVGPPAADPPARVGRISLLSGPVTFIDYRANEESEAALNWPLTSQQRLSTGRLGRAEVRIGSTSVRLDGDTVIDFNRIDDEIVQMTLQRGTAAVRVRNRDQLREIDLLTPRERIVFEDVGRYRVDVDRTPGISAITAHVGSARVVTGHTDFVVQSGQRGESTAEPMAGFHIVAPASDVFDDWVAARDRRDDSLQSTRYVSPETTGVESLDDHGEWRTVESYGAVWFPTTVVAGWAPYRYGRWAYVAPWGWTWIDDASWGFTPFHYGRWVYVGTAWGWIPGAYVARPCYAPALVAWYGTPGASVSIGIGGPVGWFPLGPGEVFIPSYYYSRRYITQVNYGPVTNITNITVINPPPHYRYRQPSYSTWAPGEALVRRTPISRVVQPAPNDWAKLQPTPHPPAKITEDFRRSKQTLVNTAAPDTAPPGAPSSRVIQPRAADPSRVEAPVRTPGARETQVDRNQREAPNRPPGAKPTPNDDRVTAPTQRAAPRSDAPRQELPRAVKRMPNDDRVGAPASRAAPRPEAPRQEVPRTESPATAMPSPRPPRTVERAPSPSSGQAGPPPQQIAPRAVPAPQAPPQTVAPHPAPMPRQEAPSVRQGPPAQRGGDGTPHARPGQKQAEPQRN